MTRLRSGAVRLRREIAVRGPNAVMVRTAVLLLCTTLTLIAPRRLADLPWLGAVIAAAAAAESIGRRFSPALVAGTGVEAAIAVTAVLMTGASSSPLFAALLAPAYVCAEAAGAAGAAVPLAVAGLSLAVGGLSGRHGDRYAGSAETWFVLTVAAALAGAIIRSIRRGAAEISDSNASYAAAYRLLAQLRTVARQLSVGLEPATIAESLLDSLREQTAYDRGAVFVRTGGQRLVPLAVTGAATVGWAVRVDEDSPFAEAWLGQRLQRLPYQFDGRAGTAMVIPLVIGLRTFGLVGLEAAQVGAFGDERALWRLTSEAALRLETALLFDEVRGLATAEERRRLAREIHDGIAQELTGVGYAVDDLLALSREGGSDLTPALTELRAEVSRLVGELRLSIFDLRSEVDAHGGLGAALSDYVRSVGQQSGMTVHLSLSVGSVRLPTAAEAELLRIAQEAITNARRHADADNLWVTLEVDPPSVLLRVEDDGHGLKDPRADSFGLAIMQERAERLRTSLTVRARAPSGTLVEVRLPGAAPRRRTMHSNRDRADGVEELFR